MSVLVFVETFENDVKQATFNALSAAQQLGDEVSAVVMGSDNSKAIAALAEYNFANVYSIEHAEFENYRAEVFVQGIKKAVEESGAKYVVGAATTTGKDLFPRVTVAVEGSMAAEIIGIEKSGDEVLYDRPAYAGNLVSRVRLKRGVNVVTVRAANFDLPEKTAGSCTRVDIDGSFVDADVRAEFVELKTVKSERPELTEAARIVSGGRGTKGAEGFTVLEELADKLGAAVGATRAVVDAGWVPNDWQVGQTGKVVAPQLYIACGISGAIQHLAGMKGSKVIVAVNKDEEAPIFKIADYGLVADLFKVVPELNEKI